MKSWLVGWSLQAALLKHSMLVYTAVMQKLRRSVNNTVAERAQRAATSENRKSTSKSKNSSLTAGARFRKEVK